MRAFPTRETMPVDDAMRAFDAVLHAMRGIVALGRFDVVHDDTAQHMAAVIQVLLAPLSDVYVALSNAAMDAQDAAASDPNN